MKPDFYSWALEIAIGEKVTETESGLIVAQLGEDAIEALLRVAIALEESYDMGAGKQSWDKWDKMLENTSQH